MFKFEVKFNKLLHIIEKFKTKNMINFLKNIFLYNFIVHEQIGKVLQKKRMIFFH